MTRQTQTSVRRPQPSGKLATVQPPSQVTELFEKGLALHQQGQFTKAKLFYEQVLAMHPQHFDALHLSGVIAAQTKNPTLAVTLIGKAIEVNPNSATAYSNLGNALKELKDMEQALASYDKAIAIEPAYAEAYYNRGLALHSLKRVEQALVSFDRAIAIKPDFAEAFHNRGLALHSLKRVEQALASFDRAIAIKSDYAEAYSCRGNALKELKRVEQAIASYDRAIAIKPNDAKAYYNRGVALQESKCAEAAAASYHKAIAIKSDYAEAHSNLGVVLQELKRAEEAVASYDRAIAIKPDYAQAYSNRGIALQELKRVEEAVACYDRAIAIRPDYAQAYSNRGIALKESKRVEEAIASFDKAIEIQPDYAEAYWNKSLALLLAGDFEQGWKFYEWRWKRDTFTSPNRNFPQPLWLGNHNIAGKTILLHAEQGLGDSIQFCRYAKLVKALRAKVVLEVPKALHGLLSGLEGVDELLETGKTLPAFDYHCPLLSLPLAFKTDLTNIPSSKPYLAASPEKCEEWAQRIGGKKKPRVGLVWSGSAGHRNDHNRSMTLQQLLRHLPVGYEYVGLQKEVREVDKSVLERSGVRHFGDELNDFTNTAALCELMDLVISVDTSVAHLAGALGKTCWVLLPYTPDWRWLFDRNDSPWYESVKLYRQDETREWSSVLELMKRDLENWR